MNSCIENFFIYFLQKSNAKSNLFCRHLPTDIQLLWMDIEFVRSIHSQRSSCLAQSTVNIKNSCYGWISNLGDPSTLNPAYARDTSTSMSRRSSCLRYIHESTQLLPSTSIKKYNGIKKIIYNDSVFILLKRNPRFGIHPTGTRDSVFILLKR